MMKWYLGNAPFDRFFAVMQQIDFMAEARRRAVAPMVPFLADPDERARQGYAMLRDRFPDLPLVPVLNEYIPQFTRYHANFPPTRRGGEALKIPALSPVVRSVVDRSNFSFVAYARKTTDTKSELFDWMRKVSIGFRELEVRLLLGEVAPQLKHSA